MFGYLFLSAFIMFEIVDAQPFFTQDEMTERRYSKSCQGPEVNKFLEMELKKEIDKIRMEVTKLNDIIKSMIPIQANIVEPAQQLKCPIGWRTFSNFCFLTITYEMKTWADAKSTCETAGAFLAEPDTEELAKGFVDVLHIPNRVFFLGGTDAEMEGKWKWMRGKSRPFSYTNWALKEPNNADGNQNCLATYYGSPDQWWDEDCNALRNFICQKPVSVG